MGEVILAIGIGCFVAAGGLMLWIFTEIIQAIREGKW